jgi:hypothetical protein
MSDTNSLTKAELHTRIEEGWNEFNAYLGTLTERQLTIPTDVAGWTAKDHVMHLAVWEGGILAVMNGKSRREGMGIDEATWKRWNVDEINAVIQRQHQSLPYAEVLDTLHQNHEQLVAKIQTTSEADLARSFRSYQPDTNYDGSLSARILANTTSHYLDHTPWIAAIAAES